MKKQHNSSRENTVFTATNPVTGKSLPDIFTESTSQEINDAIERSEKAFEQYRSKKPTERVVFLRRIGKELEIAEDRLILACSKETGLSEARLKGELKRTINQLNMFADLVSEGSWVNARIDRSDPDRQPLPKPDLRQMQIPLGVVGIFGASNFPFAFSVAGGDTASALAAGCTVVVKGHPAHPKTSELVGNAIAKAIKETNMPEHICSLVQGKSVEVGMNIVNHPLIKAIGFTGSTKGGMAIFAAAAARPEPIPVFAEMGSTNPVFILPGAMKDRASEIAKGLVSSITLGSGQFCTNPGLILTLKSSETNSFLSTIGNYFETIQAGTMLTPAIKQAYDERIKRLLNVDGVVKAASGTESDTFCEGRPYLLNTTAEIVLANPMLAEEVFGPSSLFIDIKDKDQLYRLAHNLEGHLTATVHATSEDLENYPELIKILERKVGRILFNGFPTGVEVSHSMVHGGPFPATSDSRSTSVGTGAIYRFSRPICYQDFPDEVLPEALKDSNPLHIWRLLDGEFSKE